MLLALAPAALMLALSLGLTGIESWVASFATSEGARLMLGRAGLALPYALTRETVRLIALADRVPAGETALSYADPGTAIGATIALMCGVFALRVAIKGNAAFAAAGPRRIRGKRAIHGETDWMGMGAAEKLFPEAGGIVIGERYRV
ncbi:MAG: conjugal transfer protein TraG, partial [Mesorhizobium sp.]